MFFTRTDIHFARKYSGSMQDGRRLRLASVASGGIDVRGERYRGLARDHAIDTLYQGALIPTDGWAQRVRRTTAAAPSRGQTAMSSTHRRLVLGNTQSAPFLVLGPLAERPQFPEASAMASEIDFADLAKSAANTSMKADVIETARLDEIEGSDGDRVMRVRLIGADEKVARLDGDELLDASTAIGAALRTAGEPLRIVVEYAGQRELDELGSN